MNFTIQRKKPPNDGFQKLFTGLGRSVWEKPCPWPSASGHPEDLGHGIRTSLPVNNIYSFANDNYGELKHMTVNV